MAEVTVWAHARGYDTVVELDGVVRYEDPDKGGPLSYFDTPEDAHAALESLGFWRTNAPAFTRKDAEVYHTRHNTWIIETDTTTVYLTTRDRVDNWLNENGY